MTETGFRGRNLSKRENSVCLELSFASNVNMSGSKHKQKHSNLTFFLIKMTISYISHHVVCKDEDAPQITFFMYLNIFKNCVSRSLVLEPHNHFAANETNNFRKLNDDVGSKNSSHVVKSQFFITLH